VGQSITLYRGPDSFDSCGPAIRTVHVLEALIALQLIFSTPDPMNFEMHNVLLSNVTLLQYCDYPVIEALVVGIRLNRPKALRG
jgi:hypothetical protein